MSGIPVCISCICWITPPRLSCQNLSLPGGRQGSKDTSYHSYEVDCSHTSGFHRFLYFYLPRPGGRLGLHDVKVYGTRAMNTCEETCCRPRRCGDSLPNTTDEAWKSYGCYSNTSEYFYKDTVCGDTCNGEMCCKSVCAATPYNRDSDDTSTVTHTDAISIQPSSIFTCPAGLVYNSGIDEVSCRNATDCENKCCR